MGERVGGVDWRDDELLGLCEHSRGCRQPIAMFHGSQVRRVFEIAGRDASTLREDVFYLVTNREDWFYRVVREARARLGECLAPHWMAL